ncbi:MAG TPA: anthranilate synthase component I, partial [Candidatus Eisenbacteria bacterium]|nr:anthranilate synthase component I [Candidatus Eisenbacteria bacterium]
MLAVGPVLGATSYQTRGGVTVRRTARGVDPVEAVEELIDRLDGHKGVLLASTYEYPGRYTRWDMGFIDPPIELVSRGRAFTVAALNERGAVLLPALLDRLGRCAAIESIDGDQARIEGRIRPPSRRFPEEERSRQHSVFSILRALLDCFHSPEDGHLGLYGAFGYDLAFQFEPIEFQIERPADQRDLVLYLPDRLVVADHSRGAAFEYAYEFDVDGRTTAGLSVSGSHEPYVAAASAPRSRDHAKGEYARLVEVAKGSFR